MQQLQAAVEAYQGRDLDAAEGIFKQILAVNPKEPNALHLLGCIYKDRGQLQQAVELIQASIREDGSNPIPFLNLGKILAIAGQHENAAGVFQESLKRNQQIPETWFCFGNALKEIEKVEEAKQAYRNALQLNPAHAGAAGNLGSLLTDDGELKEAERLFVKALEQAPNDVNLRINYGKLLAEKDEHAASIVQYQIALPLAPQSPELHYNFANALNEEGKVEEAIASYRKAIEVKPDFADAYLNLGIVLNEEGKVEEAIASYRKAIEVKPDFVDAISQLAGELSRSDEFDEAISLYKHALVEDSEHVNSIAGLGWCLLKSDRSHEAIEYYSNLLISSLDHTDAYFFLFEALRAELQGKLHKDFSYATNFLEQCLGLMGVSKVVAFGDSHVLLFDGCDEIDVNHVGASTAYNLVEENSSTGGRRRVLSRVARMNPMTEAVLLCFGEVDVRANVVKYCYLKGLSIQESVDGVVDRYMSFAAEIASRGFKVLIYGGYGAGSDRISVGSERERNYAAKCLNASLSVKCEQEGFVYFSLHDALLDEECLETNTSFLVDGFHLHNSELIGRWQVQTLLFERAYKAAKALFEKRKNQSSRHVVLGNVGVSSPLRIGSLELGSLSWGVEVDSLESVVFDLGASIRFDSISLELKEDLEVDQLNLMLDGRLVEVNASRESFCRWYLRPLDQAMPFIGRYPMLKASSALLLSIKGFSIKELSLV